MKKVEWPAAVLVAACDDDLDGLLDAAVRLDAGFPQIIEPAQDVVVPKRGEGKAEPTQVNDFASSKGAEHTALEKIIFGSFASPGDGGRFAARAFIFEQPFEHTDGGMERRTAALRALR